MGTPSYMAPEQARGEVERIDERADVFGLGAMLCEVLTARPPFTGESTSEVLARAQACDHAAALARLDGCRAEAELVALAKACLAAEPDARPRDAGALAQEVTTYLAGVQERLQAAERERAAAQARAEEAKKRAAAEQARAEEEKKRAAAEQARAGEAQKRAAAEQARAEEAERAAAAEQARAEEAKKKMDAEQKAWRRTMWLAAAVLLFGFLAGGWGLWWTWQRAELGRTTDADLVEVRDDLEKWKIAEAHKAMERAEGRVAGGGPTDLLGRVQQMRDALTLVKRLADIRLKATTLVEGKFPTATVDRDYATLFAEVGLAVEGEDTAVVAARIRGSVIKAQLVAALDHWATSTENPARWVWLLEVARRADPGEWSDRFRDPAAWLKREALEQLAKEAKVGELSPQLLTALGVALIITKANVVPFLTTAQERHPDDFWLNFALGSALSESNPEEAVGYYRAALALQPETSIVYNNLGGALHNKGLWDAAIKQYHRAIELDPKNVEAHYNLGTALGAKGQRDAAIEEFHRAIELDPEFVKAYHNLGTALAEQGKMDQAITAFRKAIALDPKHAKAHYNLGTALSSKGRLDEAIKEYHRAIELDPKDAKAHINLGKALADKRKLGEAIVEFHKVIALNPKDVKVHYNLGNTLKDQGKLDQAIVEYRKALDLDPKWARPHVNLGAALADKGQWDAAITEYHLAIELDPKDAVAHNNLGNALNHKGQRDEAIAELHKAIRLNPKYALAHSNLGHALRDKGDLDGAIACYKKARELDPKNALRHNNLGVALKAKGDLDGAIACYHQAIDLDPKDAHPRGALGQALLMQGRYAEAHEWTRSALDLLPQGHPLHRLVASQLQRCEQCLALDKKLPAMLTGEASPANPGEAVALAQMCQQHKKRHVAAARLYADAFAAEPKLAADLNAQHRYNAAYSAALAAAGKGEDARLLPDKVVAMFRRWALGWLRDDLTAYGKIAQQSNPQVKRALQQRLANWQRDPDLAGLRDKDAVDKLPEAERDTCQKLWADVAALLQRVQEK
jgi:tetratricopeptide (TPR) repeat protein